VPENRAWQTPPWQPPVDPPHPDPGSLRCTPQHWQTRDCISRRLTSTSCQPCASPLRASAPLCSTHRSRAAAPRGGGWGTAPTAGLESWPVLWDERPWDKIKLVMMEPEDAPGMIKQGWAHSHQGNGMKSVFKAASFIRRRGGPGVLWELWVSGAPTPPSAPSSVPGHPNTGRDGSSHCPTSRPGRGRWQQLPLLLLPSNHSGLPQNGGVAACRTPRPARPAAA